MTLLFPVFLRSQIRCVQDNAEALHTFSKDRVRGIRRTNPVHSWLWLGHVLLFMTPRPKQGTVMSITWFKWLVNVSISVTFLRFIKEEASRSKSLYIYPQLFRISLICGKTHFFQEQTMVVKICPSHGYLLTRYIEFNTKFVFGSNHSTSKRNYFSCLFILCEYYVRMIEALPRGFWFCRDLTFACRKKKKG